ncbi:MAG TPA: methyltransferase [Rhizomicrobium sp.]|jgi:predicted nicotinamide N-methyase|nr:methyltransferase [Rhizomicrobium sp.]
MIEGNPAQFVRANTELAAPPLVPEIDLHLATEVVPLWRKTEEELAAEGIPPPYWAFAWAGGQALARYVLDHRQIVVARSVLDFGTGSGLVAIAAAKSGARVVMAAEIDGFAAAAVGLNCWANGVSCMVRTPAGEGNGAGRRGEKIEIVTEDVIGRPCAWDVILVGDMCYERPLAERLLAWLVRCVRSGAEVFLGDPGRSYFPEQSTLRLATYPVRTTRELEDREIRETGVYRLIPEAKY